MFTGIVEVCGKVTAVHLGAESSRLELHYARQGRMQEVQTGESVAVNGVCLTATEPGADSFAVDLSETTLAHTTLRDLRVGSRVNLEPALRMGDALGGHWVSGHVDGTAQIAALEVKEDQSLLRITCAGALMPYLALRGSVCVDGISLTVAEVQGDTFGVTLIPHTRAQTIAADYQVGHSVNLEVDMLARYLERLLKARGSS